jgi:uncharacterized protein with PIN domain
MNAALSVNAFTVRLRFHGDLSYFLASPRTQPRLVQKRLHEKTSVKDAIESCGVPHPEVDLIVANGAPISFSHHLVNDEEIDLYPVSAPPELFPGNRLQQRGLTRFVADGHLGKLVRHLRLLGIDVRYDNDATDAQLLITATTEDRALLTRDRRLLMHAIVRHGYCPRSHDPDAQIIEVIRRFDLAELVAPYTRCLQCNGLLERVDKADVFEQLEPLTKIYYEEFRRCIGCGKIYWPGSHFGKLEARIEEIRAQANRKSAIEIRK